MEREVILKMVSGEEKTYMARTAFDQDQLDEVVNQIRDDIFDKSTEYLEDEKLLAILEEKGYIKVHSMGPEIIEIW